MQARWQSAVAVYTYMTAQGRPPRRSPLCECVCEKLRLLADAEFLLCDDRAVTVDVFADQVVEEAAALTYECLERAGCGVVLVVGLEVLGEVLDAHREESDLALGAAGVAGAASVSLEDFLLVF